MKLSDPTKNQNVASLRKRLKLLKLSLKTKLKWLVRDKKAESARAEVQKAQYRVEELTKQEMLAESITL